MAYPFAGKAIFSTRNGEYARRERIPSMRIILRSDPVEDQLTMVANLQEGFPEVCRTITSPVTDSSIYEYFDYCDAAVHGFEFLRAVLEYIAWLNAGATAERVMKVQTYVGRWMHTNAEAFTYIRPYHAVLDLFTEEDLEEYGDEFLIEAMMQIKRLRLQEDDHGMEKLLVQLARMLTMALWKIPDAHYISKCNMHICGTTNEISHSRKRQRSRHFLQIHHLHKV